MTREALSGSIYLLPMIERGNSPHRKSDCNLIEASFIFSWGFCFKDPDFINKISLIVSIRRI
jgi:hypothetical protein